MADITIYHNPACGTSRNTLALIRNSGAEPEVIEYLKTPPGKERLQGLLAAMGIPVRDAIAKQTAGGGADMTPAGVLNGVRMWVPDWNTVLSELDGDIAAYQKATGN